MKDQTTDNDYKHLYQCLLAFRSQDTDRIMTSLTSLPSIVLSNLDYTNSIASDLISSLLLLNHPSDDFPALKSTCLSILLLCCPDSFNTCFETRFFKQVSSLGERIQLLMTLSQTIWSIMGHKQKVSQWQTILDKVEGKTVKEVRKVRLIDSESKRVQEVQDKQKDKIESQSRRWGYAKLAVRDNNLVIDRLFSVKSRSFEERVIEHLKPVYQLIFFDLIDYSKQFDLTEGDIKTYSSRIRYYCQHFTTYQPLFAKFPVD